MEIYRVWDFIFYKQDVDVGVFDKKQKQLKWKFHTDSRQGYHLEV